jgi:hypothetical protein
MNGSRLLPCEHPPGCPRRGGNQDRVVQSKERDASHKRPEATRFLGTGLLALKEKAEKSPRAITLA